MIIHFSWLDEYLVYCLLSPTAHSRLLLTEECRPWSHSGEEMVKQSNININSTNFISNFNIKPISSKQHKHYIRDMYFWVSMSEKYVKKEPILGLFCIGFSLGIYCLYYSSLTISVVFFCSITYLNIYLSFCFLNN